MSITRICVFCGSRPGTDPAYIAAARETGARLAARGLGLVFGGGKVGLMGTVADAVLAGDAEAIGVIPRALVEREVAHEGLTDLHVVETMHQRKAAMAGLADAFIALPGGIGTMEELFEVWTWSVLGFHAKPVGLLNVSGYYDHLLHFLDTAVADGFFHPDHRARLLSADSPEALLAKLDAASVG
ncbi:MAG: TIGR00730 family Rossman fold protein [Bacteroidota bacterium]